MGRGSGASSNVTLEAKAQGQPSPPPRGTACGAALTALLEGWVPAGRPRGARTGRNSGLRTGGAWAPAQKPGSGVQGTGREDPGGGARPGGAGPEGQVPGRGGSRKAGALGAGLGVGRPHLGGRRVAVEGPQAGPAHDRPQEGAREAAPSTTNGMLYLQVGGGVQPCRPGPAQPVAWERPPAGGRPGASSPETAGQAGSKGTKPWAPVPWQRLASREKAARGQLPGVRPGSAPGGQLPGVGPASALPQLCS